MENFLNFIQNHDTISSVVAVQLFNEAVRAQKWFTGDSIGHLLVVGLKGAIRAIWETIRRDKVS